MQLKGNFIQVPTSQPPHPILPLPLYLNTLLLQVSFVKLQLHRQLNVVGVRPLLIVIVSHIEDAKETLRRSAQELDELGSTAHNTYVNPGSVPQFDFHQSDKSIVLILAFS
jgi:hypothetical protein